MEKVDVMISRAWRSLLRVTRYRVCSISCFGLLAQSNERILSYVFRYSYELLFCYRIDRLFSRKPQVKQKKDTKKTDEINEDEEEPELFVERVRLEKIELRLLISLLNDFVDYKTNSL